LLACVHQSTSIFKVSNVATNVDCKTTTNGDRKRLVLIHQLRSQYASTVLPTPRNPVINTIFELEDRKSFHSNFMTS
jgi:hypothetical protein